LAEEARPLAVESILITGGGSGIGAALAVALAGRGCRVLITGRRQDALFAVASGRDAISTCAGDVTHPDHRSELVRRLSRLPGPRAIVHGAGTFQPGLLKDLAETDWRRSFEINVGARWALSRDCERLLIGGRLLFIGSDSGSNPRVGAAAYSIAQAASETLRRALQAEWADRGIAVGGFKPGLVDTEMVRGFLALSPDEFPARAVYESYVSSGRIAGPEVVARFAAWLLLDVPAGRFVETDWDIRQTDHHAEWCDGPLYPDCIERPIC